VTSQKLTKLNLGCPTVGGEASFLNLNKCTGTIVSNQSTFVNLIYDPETKLTGTIVFQPQQSTGTIVSNQSAFVNLIYDFETKFTGTIVFQPLQSTGTIVSNQSTFVN